MFKRLLPVLASVGLLLAAVALLWQVNPADAQQPPRQYRLFAPLIEKATSGSYPSTLRVSITGQLNANGNIAYRVQITNLVNQTVNRVPLEFGYNSGNLAFLSSQFSPDERSPGVLRWNDITAFPGIGDIGPAGTASATKTFDILMDPVVCPEGGAVFVQALVSGALNSANQLIPPAAADFGLKVCTSLEITKTLVDRPSGNALIGDDITYEIVVTNPAANASAPPNLRVARDVAITDRFNPDIFNLVQGQVSLDGVTFSPISPTLPITPAGSITFNPRGASLDPGESLRMRVLFTVRACSSEEGTVNTAEVGSPAATGGLVTLARARSQSLRIICPNISVTKRVKAPAENMIGIGELVTFTIAVKATGNQAINVIPMEDVFDPTVLQFVSSDPSPVGAAIYGSVIWDDLVESRGQVLRPGETYTVTAVFRAIGCPLGGTTANRARIGNAISSGGGYGFNAPQASDTIELDVACPRVDVEKRLITPRSGLIQEQGGRATFEVIVRNTGNLPLTTLPLTDTFDSSLFRLVDTSVRPTTQTGGRLTWSNLAASAPLAPGESIVVIVVLETIVCPTSDRPITSYNRVGVTGALADFRGRSFDVPADTDEAAIDVVCAQIKISKTLVAPPSGVVSPGVQGRNTLSFRIDISNTGNITVTRLPLRDTWDDAYMEYVPGSAQPAPTTFGPGVVVWDDLAAGAPMRPGERRTITVQFRAKGCPPDQIVRNLATIEGALAIPAGAGVPAPVPSVFAADDARIACPRVEVEKRLVAEPNCDIVGVNQEVSFDIIVRNTGNTTLVTIPLTDTFEANYLQFLRAEPTPNTVTPPTGGPGVNSTSTLIWNDITAAAPNGLGRDLAPGDSMTVRVTFRTIRSTRDIQRSPSGYTLNRAGVTGAMDEYGFTAAPFIAAPARLRIAQSDLYLEKVQSSQQYEVQVVNSEQLTDVLGIGWTTDHTSNRVALPGEVITYTVRYGNRGPDKAEAVRIIDVIPPGTVYLGHNLPQCINRDIREGCFIGDLEAGQTGQFEVYVRVPRVTEQGFSTPPGTTLVNTVSIVSGLTPEGPVCGIPDNLPNDNQSSWSTDVLGEFGDVPATQQPGLNGPGYGATATAAYSGNYKYEWLGRAVSGERSATDPRDVDGRPNLDPWNTDLLDDGVLFRNPFASLSSAQTTYQLREFVVTRLIVGVDNPNSSRYGLPADRKIYVTAWADTNFNGQFGDVDDQIIFRWNGAPGETGTDGSFWDPTQPFKQIDLPMNMPGQIGWMMVRVRLNYGAPPVPTGPMDYGEIEDYLIGVFEGTPPSFVPGPPQPPRRP